jgi:hypothetical protein
MIRIEQPALAINSPDVPEPRFTMWDTHYAFWGTNATILASWILDFARRRSGQGFPLLNVIINCHGNDGILSVGGIGYPPIGIRDVPAFSVLKPHFVHGPTLWLTGCLVANSPNGQAFCSALAKACGCRVVAGSSEQFRYRGYRQDDYWVELNRQGNVSLGKGNYSGVIDEYEGFVYQWDRNGNRSGCNPHRLLDAGSS